MNYYIFRQDDRVPDQPSVMNCPHNIDPLDWIEGKPLADPGPLRLSLSPGNAKFRGGIISGVLTLFHQRLIKELLRLGISNFQHFPVELENSEGQVELTYSLINVIGMMEAVNAEESVIEPRATGGRGQLYSFKIDPEKVNNQKFFRLAEAPSLIIIDETLRNELLAFNPPGVIMLPTERYNGW
ncbi:MAG: hypothetical protein JW982_07455 [Spirochaetes bacterium]|nr:hypothetical protein [Spirochaetota bacterium]